MRWLIGDSRRPHVETERDVVTLADAEQWLRDSADGLWTAEKHAGRCAPVLLREYRDRARRIAELQNLHTTREGTIR